MGIVAKQSIYSSIASYIGIIIGALNTIILFPNIFTPDQFGLTRVLGAASVMLAAFGSLGMQNVTLKFFPFFQDKKRKHNGFLFIILTVPFIGYLILTALSYLFKGDIIGYYSDTSNLFGEYFNYIALFTFYIIYFNMLDAYLRALYKTVIFVFLQNVVLRVLWMILIFLYYFEILNFDQFIFYYVNVHVLVIVVELIYIAYIKELFLAPNFKNIDGKLIRQMIVFGLYVILGASSGMVTGTIDALMIGALVDDGLVHVAYYSIALYIGIMIMIPYGAIMRIATTIISESWKNNDIAKIGKIYKQTSINLMIIGTLLFLGIWLNADNIFKLLPPEYAEAKYVLLFICLAKLYDVSTGVNATIIQYSKFFKLMLYFNIFLIALLVGTNFLLIPEYGIIGAAIATLISVFIVNTIRLIIIKIKMGVLPFTKKSIYVPIIGTITYLIVYFIPTFDSYIVDAIIRSLVIVILYVPVIYFFKLSEEFNGLIDKILIAVKLKK